MNIIFWLLIIVYLIYLANLFDQQKRKTTKILICLQEDDYIYLLKSLYGTKYKVLIKKRIVNCFVATLLLVLLDYPNYSQILISKLILVNVLVYKAHYWYIKQKWKNQLSKAVKAFPYYLNTLNILIEENAINLALLKSIDYAPLIFKQDLNELVWQLHHNPRDFKPYRQFIKQFPQISDLNRIMRNLYTISIDAGNKETLLRALTMLTNEKIQQARQQHFNQLLDRQALMPWISFIWVGLFIICLLAFINIGGM